mgnify:CR=1 FL=1
MATGGYWWLLVATDDYSLQQGSSKEGGVGRERRREEETERETRGGGWGGGGGEVCTSGIDTVLVLCWTMITECGRCCGILTAGFGRYHHWVCERCMQRVRVRQTQEMRTWHGCESWLRISIGSIAENVCPCAPWIQDRSTEKQFKAGQLERSRRGDRDAPACWLLCCLCVAKASA